MATITKEEVKKIAHIAHIALDEHEIEPLTQQMQAVLSYASRVQEIAAAVELPSHKAINVFRQDSVIATNPEPLLAQAPEVEEHYFVVPKILESNQ
jgi:aspartyl-tRNA(Asn)/glutamyl-tRNA(Gln) amidotransferase subunit C